MGNGATLRRQCSRPSSTLPITDRLWNGAAHFDGTPCFLPKCPIPMTPWRSILKSYAEFPMDRAEEIACMEHVRARNEIAEAATKCLVEANLGLVVTHAERHRSEHIHILDLIVKGNEGLLHAVQGLVDHTPDSFAPHAT